MKPQQYNMLQMQVKKVSEHSVQLVALIRLLHYLLEQDDYYYPKSDISEFRDIIFTYATRLRQEAINLKSYFELHL